MYMGIDGCRAGWVVATIDEQQLHLRLVNSLQELSGLPISTLYIDMPLQFAYQGYRACEIAAQKLLGRHKRASVFLTPYREAVYAESFAEANRMNKELAGKGVSIQAWNICPKIKEAVTFMEGNPHLSLREAHPELCFYFLNSGQPLLSKKSSSQGIADRMKIIEAASTSYPTVIEDFLSRTKRIAVKPDDVLDAAVLVIRAASGNLQMVLTEEQAMEVGNIYY